MEPPPLEMAEVRDGRGDGEAARMASLASPKRTICCRRLGLASWCRFIVHRFLMAQSSAFRPGLVVELPSTEPGFCPASVVPGAHVGPDLCVRTVTAANASGEDTAHKDSDRAIAPRRDTQ